MKSLRVICSMLLLVFLGACSMNADQEANLSAATNEYIDARNNNRVSIWVRLTYPDAIRFYKNLGDDSFLDKFKPENNQVHFQDGRITEIESKGKVMHVEYEYLVIKEVKNVVSSDKQMIYGISLDDGIHWKFLDRADYTNDKILPKSKRLI